MSIYVGNKKIAGLYRGEDVSHATEEHAGIIEIATSEEVELGVDDTKAITPKKLKERNYQNKTTFNAPTDEANTLVDNNSAPLGTLTENTTVTVPANIQQGFITGFTFNEPSTLKTLTINYASSGASAFSMIGLDCADGLFTPVVNKHYDVTLYYDGYLLTGVVNGVAI